MPTLWAESHIAKEMSPEKSKSQGKSQSTWHYDLILTHAVTKPSLVTCLEDLKECHPNSDNRPLLSFHAQPFILGHNYCCLEAGVPKLSPKVSSRCCHCWCQTDEGISVWVMPMLSIYTPMRGASANSWLWGEDREPTELSSTSAYLPEFRWRRSSSGWMKDCE